MKATALISISFFTTLISACAQNPFTPLKPPESSGEANAGYTYVPVDPFPVDVQPGDGCTKPPSYVNLPDALPDNSVRMLIESIDTSGNVSYLASKAAAQYQRYRVTVDYVNADTINLPIWMAITMTPKTGGGPSYVQPYGRNWGAKFDPDSEAITIQSTPPTDKDMQAEPGLTPYNIPIYIGIGLRVSANVYTTTANANISGIGVIGAEADAQHLTGSLIVQTIGVNGKSVEAALPIQSDLNRTTAENAIVAVGTVKALLYNNDTQKRERVVGMYLPFQADQAIVNALISVLSRTQVPWKRPCVTLVKSTGNEEPLALTPKPDAGGLVGPTSEPEKDKKPDAKEKNENKTVNSKAFVPPLNSQRPITKEKEIKPNLKSPSTGNDSVRKSVEEKRPG